PDARPSRVCACGVGPCARRERRQQDEGGECQCPRSRQCAGVGRRAAGLHRTCATAAVAGVRRIEGGRAAVHRQTQSMSVMAVTVSATFGGHTPADAVADFINAARASGSADALAALLPESLPLYAGRSTNETARLRGYVLASFEQVGLPEVAVPFVLEELESGREAYLVAAAAKAVRGFSHPCQDIVSYLLIALDNIRLHDDVVTFAGYRPR